MIPGSASSKSPRSSRSWARLRSVTGEAVPSNEAATSWSGRRSESAGRPAGRTRARCRRSGRRSRCQGLVGLGIEAPVHYLTQESALRACPELLVGVGCERPASVLAVNHENCARRRTRSHRRGRRWRAGRFEVARNDRGISFCHSQRAVPLPCWSSPLFEWLVVEASRVSAWASGLPGAAVVTNRVCPWVPSTVKVW
jgi:hypothetical protein